MTEKETRGFEDLECYQLAMKVYTKAIGLRLICRLRKSIILPIDYVAR